MCIALAGARGPPITGEAVDLGEASRQVAVTEGAAAAAGARPARLCSRPGKESEREMDGGGGGSERKRQGEKKRHSYTGGEFDHSYTGGEFDAILFETMMRCEDPLLQRVRTRCGHRVATQHPHTGK